MRISERFSEDLLQEIFFYFFQGRILYSEENYFFQKFSHGKKTYFFFFFSKERNSFKNKISLFAKSVQKKNIFVRMKRFYFQDFLPGNRHLYVTFIQEKFQEDFLFFPGVFFII